MAIAAGFADAKVIYVIFNYQHLAPKDTVEKAEQPLPVNHAWCAAVKVEGEYRFVDCWLASPYHPYNDNKIDPHWFLTLPSDMAMTHFPEKKKNQHLFRSITPHAFFSIPYVRNVFFWNKMYVLDYKMHQSDSIVYMSLKVLPKTHCYAEIESENGIHSRGLTQCSKEDEERLCKIKAVLPAGHTKGWLKVYTQQRGVQKGQLAMCLQVTASQPSTGFDFVKLHGLDNPDGFHVQEPQCYQLYPLQTYRFVIGGSRPMYRAAHHKLAVKSPHGKLHKLTYQPQDQSYEVNVKVSEVGKWLLVCLVHHTGGWYAVAEWNCMVSK
ncbi:hypothetical protein BY458DRAFT_436516 [Sporodiniella umbellata]|nr:hypothetical protein BY458DRAFT_436516 [Sporodiniella umbellata]